MIGAGYVGRGLAHLLHRLDGSAALWSSTARPSAPSRLCASPTLLRHVAVELSGATHRALYIPTAFAHGFQTLVDDTEVEYSMGASYEKEAGRGVRFDDPALGLRWPRPVTTVSDRDASWPDVVGRTRALLD